VLDDDGRVGAQAAGVSARDFFIVDLSAPAS
jgi:hypothetical protein